MTDENAEKKSVHLIGEVIEVTYPAVNEYIANGWVLLKVDSSRPPPRYEIGWPKPWPAWYPEGEKPQQDA